jgi:hypothetical protein
LKKTVDHNPNIDNGKLKELISNELETMFTANDTKVLKETAEHDTICTTLQKDMNDICTA